MASGVYSSAHATVPLHVQQRGLRSPRKSTGWLSAAISVCSLPLHRFRYPEQAAKQPSVPLTCCSFQCGCLVLTSEDGAPIQAAAALIQYSLGPDGQADCWRFQATKVQAVASL